MLEMFENRALLQHLAILALLLAAWRWGDAPERLSAVILVAMPILEVAYHLGFGAGYVVSDLDIGHFIISLTASTALLAIALYANRRYPIWLVSFQLISLLTHVVKDFSDREMSIAYQIMVIAPSYCMMLTLLLGIVYHRRRYSRYGQYRPWRTSLPRSQDRMPQFMPRN